MVTLIEREKSDTPSKIRMYSIVLLVSSLFILDKYFVRREGNYVIIGNIALTAMDMVILFLFALALISLLRPMEHKKYQKRN